MPAQTGRDRQDLWGNEYPRQRTHIGETQWHWNDHDGGRHIAEDDALGRLPVLSKHVDTYVGVKERKRECLDHMKLGRMLRKLKCHLSSNLFSIKPEPEWSWDRDHNELAYKTDCAREWETSYGTLFGFVCSVGFMLGVLWYSISALVSFADEKEVFTEFSSTSLTNPNNCIGCSSQDVRAQLLKLTVPPIGAMLRVASRLGQFATNGSSYDERYHKVTFTQFIVYQQGRSPKSQFIYDTTTCTGFHGDQDDELTLCPDISAAAQPGDQWDEHSDEKLSFPHAMGDWADQEYHYFEVGFRRCSNVTDNLKPKLVVKDGVAPYTTTDPCAPVEETDEMLFSGAGGMAEVIAANASMPNMGKTRETDKQGDWNRHSRFAKGLRQNADVFLSIHNVTRKSKFVEWWEPSTHESYTYVKNLETYLQNFEPQKDGAMYSKFWFRCAPQASKIKLRPTSFLEVISKVGGFGKFLHVVIGFFAVWWTKRRWDRVTRDLYFMGGHAAHRIQLPKIRLDATQLDEALTEAGLPEPDDPERENLVGSVSDLPPPIRPDRMASKLQQDGVPPTQDDDTL